MPTYTTKAGEDLGAIARKFGLPNWKYLYEKNQEIIGDNPDLLHEGTKLEIPLGDSTSGDELIEEKGGQVSRYVGGLSWRYPWQRFSLSLVDEENQPLESATDEGYEVKITNKKRDTVIVEKNIENSTELDVLLPDTPDINIGIKGVQLNINGEFHTHPDDAPQSGVQEESE